MVSFSQVSQPESCAHLSPPPYAPNTCGSFCLQRKHLDLWVFLKMGFHGETLLAPRPMPKLEDHSLCAVRDCLFNLFTATLHIGGRSSIRNLRTRHAVVTGTHRTWIDGTIILKLISSKWDGVAWARLLWLRNGMGGELLWMWWWTCGFHKVW